MEIIRVEVIKPTGRHRKFKPLWLAWVGKTMPTLDGNRSQDLSCYCEE